jgi:hypothetical protein
MHPEELKKTRQHGRPFSLIYILCVAQAAYFQ